MLEKQSPESFTILTYLWVFSIAIMGGLVSYLKRVVEGKKWSLIDFIVCLLTSAFVGLTMFFICICLGIGEAGASAAAGIAGHFSREALRLFKSLLQRLVGRLEDRNE